MHGTVQKRMTPAVYDFISDVLQPAEDEGTTAAAAGGRLKKEERIVPDIIFQVCVLSTEHPHTRRMLALFSGINIE